MENRVQYFGDISDVSKLATDPNVTTPVPSRNFVPILIIADIVAVNGQPAKGAAVFHIRQINLRTAPNAGEAIADVVRNNVVDIKFEILKSDGTPIGTIIASGLGGGAPPPGAPIEVRLGNNAIVGGTGAFLGARGQMGQGAIAVPDRNASMTEDPANRRTHDGGRVRYVLHVIPMALPQIVTTASGPVVFHSSDFSPVTTAKPAKAGEVLITMATGVGPTRPGVDPGQPFPAYPSASGHGDHAAKAIQHAPHEAIQTIHRFIGEVSLPEQQAQIAERMVELEGAVARVEAAYKNKQND